MRREHTGQQKRGERTIPQNIAGAQKPQDQRNNEGERPEDDALVFILLKGIHVHLQTRQEHDVEQPDGTEQHHAFVALQHTQTMWPQQHPR